MRDYEKKEGSQTAKAYARSARSTAQRNRKQNTVKEEDPLELQSVAVSKINRHKTTREAEEQEKGR